MPAVHENGTGLAKRQGDEVGPGRATDDDRTAYFAVNVIEPSPDKVNWQIATKLAIPSRRCSERRATGSDRPKRSVEMFGLAEHPLAGEISPSRQISVLDEEPTARPQRGDELIEQRQS